MHDRIAFFKKVVKKLMMISSTTIHQIHLFFLEIFKVRCQCQTQHLRKTRLFPSLRFRTKIIYIFLPTQILKRLKDFDCFWFSTQKIYGIKCLWTDGSSKLFAWPSDSNTACSITQVEIFINLSPCNKSELRCQRTYTNFQNKSFFLP